ncbi:MAG: phage head-tail connector protein [Alphaproteobacteria bacterium]|nr:phage head-tail connector protein [Alphaproteobacteria bacterium]
MSRLMGLRQQQAPEREPISLLQAKIFLHVDGDIEDELIVRLIKTARQGVESYTGRSLIKQAWTFTFNAGFAAAKSDGSYLSQSHSRAVGGIELPRSPFLELIGKPQLKTGSGNKEITQYRLDTAGRVARLHVSDMSDPHENVEVTFWAGYGADPEEVPEPLRQGVLMTAANLYEARGAANDAGLIPMPLSAPVIQLIKPYRMQRFLA